MQLITIGLVCYAGLNLCDFLVKSIVRFLFMRQYHEPDSTLKGGVWA